MSDGPRFHVGQVIHHKRYDYRGVIVGFDMTCQADEDWYQSNKTQPERNQPWYHVLVHDSHHTTYVAQTNLEPDTTQGPVTHPLIKRFFGSFLDGRYFKENLN